MASRIGETVLRTKEWPAPESRSAACGPHSSNSSPHIGIEPMFLERLSPRPVPAPPSSSRAPACATIFVALDSFFREGAPEGHVPVAVRDKVRAVSQDLGGQARLARILGVSPSRVSRWIQSEDPDPSNRRKVEDVEFVLSRLLQFLDKETAIKWLQGMNAHLGDRRPIDLLANGRVAEVLEAIEAEETGAYA